MNAEMRVDPHVLNNPVFFSMLQHAVCALIMSQHLMTAGM